MAEQSQHAKSTLLRYDPIVVLRDVLQRWYLVVAVFLLVGAAARTGLELSYRPVYTTNTTLVVTSRSSTTSVYQNLSRTSELAGVLTEVLNSSILRDKMLEELQMDSFDGSISAAPVGATNLLTVKVTASDPRTAFLVNRCIIENHSIVSAQVLGDVTLDVLQNPKVPLSPSNYNDSIHQSRLLAGAAAVAACVLLGFLSCTRDVVRSRREAPEKLDCHCLAEIGHERKFKTLRSHLHRQKSSILLTKPNVSFRFTESFQKLRRRLELRMGKEHKVVLVTSILENEGKSTVVANLALSSALAGRKTLLIDCDLRKPACYKIFHHPEFSGSTTDVILGRRKLCDAVWTDPISELDLLLERKASASASSYIHDNGLAAVLEEARKQYDIIIIDTPPMSVAPDAETVAALCDGALLVVRQNSAPAIQINRAISSMKAVGAPVYGCVLNNVRSSGLGRAGHGVYGYGYGHYGSYKAYGNYQHNAQSSHTGSRQ